MRSDNCDVLCEMTLQIQGYSRTRGKPASRPSVRQLYCQTTINSLLLAFSLSWTCQLTMMAKGWIPIWWWWWSKRDTSNNQWSVGRINASILAWVWSLISDAGHHATWQRPTGSNLCMNVADIMWPVLTCVWWWPTTSVICTRPYLGLLALLWHFVSNYSHWSARLCKSLKATCFLGSNLYHTFIALIALVISVPIGKSDTRLI